MRANIGLPASESLGKFIARAREDRTGKTQIEFAHELGWSRRTLSSIETGNRPLYDAEEVARVAKALKLGVEDLRRAVTQEEHEANLSFTSGWRMEPLPESEIYSPEKFIREEPVSFRKRLDDVSGMVSKNDYGEALGLAQDLATVALKLDWLREDAVKDEDPELGVAYLKLRFAMYKGIDAESDRFHR